jgi:hypothetical protein
MKFAEDTLSATKLLALQTPQNKWAVAGILPRRGLVMLAAARKGKKTMVALALALAVTSGAQALGAFTVVEPGPVLFVGTEMTVSEAQERLPALAAPMGVSPAQDDLHFWRFDRRLDLSDPNDVARLRARMTVIKPKLVFIDTLRRTFRRLKENDNDSAAEALQGLAKLCDDLDCSIVICHHVTKSNGGEPASDPFASIRGAGDFTGVTTQNIHMQESKKGYLRIRTLPRESAPEDWRVHYAIEAEQALDDGVTYPSINKALGRLKGLTFHAEVWPQGPEKDEEKAVSPSTILIAKKVALKTVLLQAIGSSPKGLSKNDLYKSAHSSETFDGAGKTAVNAALSELLADASIVVADGRYWLMKGANQ